MTTTSWASVFRLKRDHTRAHHLFNAVRGHKTKQVRSFPPVRPGRIGLVFTAADFINPCLNAYFDNFAGFVCHTCCSGGLLTAHLIRDMEVDLTIPIPHAAAPHALNTTRQTHAVDTRQLYSLDDVLGPVSAPLWLDCGC